MANKLKALPSTTVAQDGDDGATVVFHARHFDEVARIMKPRKRRRLSASERQKRAERLQEYWADKRQVRTLAEANRGAIGGRDHTLAMQEANVQDPGL